MGLYSLCDNVEIAEEIEFHVFHYAAPFFLDSAGKPIIAYNPNFWWKRYKITGGGEIIRHIIYG